MARLKNVTGDVPCPLESAQSLLATAIHDLGDYDYVPSGKVKQYKQGVVRAIKLIAQMLHTGHAANALSLVEWGIEALNSVSSCVDDQNREMESLVESLERVHRAACNLLRPQIDPVDLARRMFGMQTRCAIPVFRKNWRRYAEILGETGMAEYRKLTEENRRSSDSTVQPTRQEFDSDRENLTAAERTIHRIWNEFCGCPTLAAYRRLQRRSERNGSWPEWRTRALLEIRMRAREAMLRSEHMDHSILVEIFLYENEIEAAWVEAQEAGCSRHLWARLSLQRMDSHPEEAGRALFEQAQAGLRDRVSPISCETAVHWLIEASRAMQNAGKVREFTAQLLILRNEFRTNLELMDLLALKRRQLLLF